jgi:serine/threonine-protein kinase
MGPEQDYRIGAVIGRGGAGVVHEATHRRLGLLAAIKRLPGLDATVEAAKMARIDHPNVLRVFDAGREGDGSWFAMQRAVGPVRAARDAGTWHHILTAVLEGLAAAHASGVLHLDLKPGNLLRLEDGTVALADFGLAALGTAARPTLGTPAWMAPEAFGGHADARSDLYSVGCIGYALLAGRPPYTGADLAEAHRHLPVPPLPADRPVPEGAWDWLQTLLAKHPDDRFQHPADALAALLRVAHHPRAVPRVETVDLDGPTVPLSTSTGGAVAATGTPPPVPLPEAAPPWPRRPDRALAGIGLLGLHPIPFTGREAEVEAVWAVLTEVQRTRSSVHLAVVGPRGAGVTRFIDEVCRRAWAAGAGREPGERVAVVRTPTTGPATLWIDEDAAVADRVVTLPTLSTADARTALAAWGPCDRRLVTTLADRCGGDLGLALRIVEERLRTGDLVWNGDSLSERGSVGSTVPDDLLRTVHAVVADMPDTAAAAAAMGHDVDTEWLARATGDDTLRHTLCAAGLASPLADGFRWASGDVRLAAARVGTVDHARLAGAVRGDDDHAAWHRALHRALAGDLDAVPSLLNLVGSRAGAGAMVETEVQLRAIEALLGEQAVPASDPVWARLYHAFAGLGPTHLGHAAAATYGRRALSCLETAPEEVQRELLPLVHSRLAWLGAMQGMPRMARPHVEASLRLDPTSRGGALGLGYVLLGEGRSAAAHLAFLTAARRAADRGDVYGEHSSAGAACIALRYLGRHDEAIAGFELHLARLHAAGFHAADADTRFNVADALRASGHREEARAAYLDAIRLSQTGQSRAGLGFELGYGVALAAWGELEAAEALLAGCQARLDDEGPSWEALTGLHLLAVRTRRGSPAPPAAIEAHLDRLADAGHVEPDLLDALESLAHHPRALVVARRMAAQLERGRVLDRADLALLAEPVGDYSPAAG